MQTFDSDGVGIAYRDEGEGETILLIHGFASSSAVNWVNTSWFEALRREGFRVVAIDNRGHGQSEKLYDVNAYGAPIMAEDARRLLDRAGVASAHVMGYSMGARIATFLALNHPGRVKSLVIAGSGVNLVLGMGAPGPIAAALEAPSADEVTNAAAKSFRVFAEQTGSDLKALAACMRSPRYKIEPEALARLAMPVLIAVGTEDVIAGSARDLAALIPGAEVLDIPGRDHMKAVGDRIYKEGALAFLARRRGGAG